MLGLFALKKRSHPSGWLFSFPQQPPLLLPAECGLFYCRNPERERDMIGRPSSYSEETADAILTRIADGEPLSRICKDDGMPSMPTVYRWLEANEDFRNRYVRAREEQADTLADDIVRIADEPPPPESEAGKIDSAWVAWQKNRIEARKWTAAKLKPKKYGEKTETEVTHKGGFTVTWANPEES